MSYWPVHKMMKLRKALSPETTNKLSDKFESLISRYIEPYESIGPKVNTKFPGPNVLAANDVISESIANSHSLREVINLEKSFGNYFEDVDGNVVLDMHMDNGRNILGYNSRRWVKETKLQKYDKFLIQRPAMGVLPPAEYPKLLNEFMLKIAPLGLGEVYLSCGCGSSANINAIKIASLKKFFELKGNNNFTKEEEESVLEGRAPGAPKFKVIGFEGGYHGQFLDLLSLSKFNTNSSIARHDWPIAPFPKLKFPYEENYTENRTEEIRCLEETKKLILANKDSVAAMIIEPLQLQGGVRYASSLFYRDLLDLCEENKVTFIVDETQTSGWAGGRAFMHRNWNLEKPAHMVTFGGRMQVAGVLYKKEYRPKFGNMINSTWNGDPAKLVQLFDTMHQITNVDWIDSHTQTFWQGTKTELLDLQRKSSFAISNIRGVGKIFAFDVEHELIRNEIVDESRNNGFKVNPIGKNTIAFTPSLMFTEVHFAKYKNFLSQFVPATLNMKAFSH